MNSHHWPKQHELNSRQKGWPSSLLQTSHTLTADRHDTRSEPKGLPTRVTQRAQRSGLIRSVRVWKCVCAAPHLKVTGMEHVPDDDDFFMPLPQLSLLLGPPVQLSAWTKTKTLRHQWELMLSCSKRIKLSTNFLSNLCPLNQTEARRHFPTISKEIWLKGFIRNKRNRYVPGLQGSARHIYWLLTVSLARFRHPKWPTTAQLQMISWGVQLSKHLKYTRAFTSEIKHDVS